jgi:carbon-monoxide dehydrogenase large subunit
VTVAGRFVGQRVARHEDARFLTGRGRYVDDITLPGTLHVAFARSDTARGRLEPVDVAAARELPGVVAVYLAADLAHLIVDFKTDDEPHGRERPFRLLADGEVRYVGEPIAMVVAESRYIAEDGVDAITIDIEYEEPLLDPRRATEADAPLVHPNTTTNVYNEVPRRATDGFDDVLTSAPVVLTETFVQHRHATVPMEGRAILANWDRAAEDLTVWLSTQGPHGARSQFARVLGIDDSQVRVIMPDVGGSFGLKMFPRPEELAVVLASTLVGRPVKWIQDRSENLIADEHARDDQATVTLASDERGLFLAMEVDFVEGAGAFPTPGGSAIALSTVIFPGTYRVAAFARSGRSVMTNTSGRGGYRGPWMIETVAREQMIDHLARSLGIDPLELRRRNVLRDDDLPYTMAGGLTYDQMTAHATLEQAAATFGYDDVRAEQARRRSEGRLVGIGMSLFAEPTAFATGWMSTDAAVVRIGMNGRVDVAHSGASHGQSLETTIAQVVADELGVDIANIRVSQGDTDYAPIGPGTGGSRSAVIVNGAVLEAAREIRERMLAIVAQELEVDPADLEIVDGRVQAVGTPARGMSMAEVARLAYTSPARLPSGQALGLEAHSRYSPGSFVTWANACHMCLCEVDRVTGAVAIERYVVSEDCGPLINPSVVEGQIAGGVVQGIGGVLYEHIPYDAAGNPLAGTFVDYLMPTATEVPTIEYAHIETRAPSNPAGYKGLGEGGAIGSPPAIINAIADALAPLGVTVRTQPLGPSDVARLIDGGAT